jgi:hypothetical protein
MADLTTLMVKNTPIHHISIGLVVLVVNFSILAVDNIKVTGILSKPKNYIFVVETKFSL